MDGGTATASEDGKAVLYTPAGAAGDTETFTYEIDWGDGTVDVVFRVERGPRIEVTWQGDDPGRKLRKRFGDTWDSFLPLEETAANRARLSDS